jgi:cell division protein FtsZ
MATPLSAGNVNVPSVWRTRDRTQAAAKVDAMSSGGMDNYEIPAFLRKQAD